MSVIIAKNWWSLVIRGMAALALGLVSVVKPGVSLLTLVLMFFAYALVDGLAAFAGAVRAAEANERWWPLLAEGVAGITTAAITIAWPGLTDMTLVYLVAAWASITGIFEVTAAMRLRRYVKGEWLLALSGFASLLLAMLMIAIPLASAVTLEFWIGVYAFIFGVLLLALGFRLRAWVRGPAAHARF